MSQSPPVRVVLMDCAALLGDLIRSVVSARPELQVVADLVGEEMPTATRYRPDVVLWQLTDERQLCTGSDPFGLGSWPAIVAVCDDGRSGAIWRLRPQRVPIGELSPDSLAAAIVAAGSDRSDWPPVTVE